MALRIPAIGGVVEGLQPVTLFSIVVALGLAVLLAFTYRPRRGRTWPHRRRHAGGTAMGAILRGEFFALTSTGARVAAGFTAIALLATLGIAVTQSLGTTHMETAPRSYQHVGEFEYEAKGAPGVYDDGIARTGDPVFRQIADRVDTRFTYRFESTAPAEVHGTYRIEARLTQANGWNRTLQVVPATPFDGPGFTASAPLYFALLQEAIDAMERQTGVESRAYALSITARIVLEGSVAGQVLDEHFEPEQRFLLDALILQPQPARGENDLSFIRSESGSVLVTREAERALTVGTLSLSFERLRVGSIIILALSALAVAGWLIATMIARRQAEDIVIEAQYSDILVHSQLDRLPADAVLISVESMEELVRIAKTHNLPVLDEHAPNDEMRPYYLVVSPSGATYYYRSRAVFTANHATDSR